MPTENEKIDDNMAKAQTFKKILDETAPDFPDSVKSTAVMMTAMGCSPDSIINVMTGMLNISETAKGELANPEPVEPEDYYPIERAIAKMLHENTGCAIGDNAGYCGGRNWERSRTVTDFRNTPEVIAHIGETAEDVTTTQSLFHYLKGVLDVDDETDAMQERFDAWCKENDECGMSAMEGFVEACDFPSEYGVMNTYNDEYNSLSQVIQYIIFDDEDENRLVLLQIHGGADVRGGYTDPKVFKCSDEILQAGNSFTAACGCGTLYHEESSWQDYDREFVKSKGQPPKSWKVIKDKDYATSYNKHIHCSKCKQNVVIE